MAAGRRLDRAGRCARADRRSAPRSSRKARGSIARRVAPIVVLALVANAGLIRDRLDVRLPDAIVAPALLMVWLVYQAWRMPPRPVWLAARVVAVAALLVTMRYAAVMGSVRGTARPRECAGGTRSRSRASGIARARDGSAVGRTARAVSRRR